MDIVSVWEKDRTYDPYSEDKEWLRLLKCHNSVEIKKVQKKDMSSDRLHWYRNFQQLERRYILAGWEGVNRNEREKSSSLVAIIEEFAKLPNIQDSFNVNNSLDVIKNLENIS